MGGLVKGTLRPLFAAYRGISSASVRIQVQLAAFMEGLQTAMWAEYRAAGAIYGESEDGMRRWMEEMAEARRLREQAEAIETWHEMLRDLQSSLRGRSVSPDGDL